MSKVIDFDRERLVPGHDGPTKRRKIEVPGGVPPKAIEPWRYKDLVKKMEHYGSVDAKDFNNAKDLTNFLDFYNQTNDKRKEEELGITARDIAKSLVNDMGSKTFLV